MKRRKEIGMILVGIFFLGYLITGIRAGGETKSFQKGISGEILRFHVIANSDRKEDQVLKLKVKDAVVEEMKELLLGADDLEESIQRVNKDKENLEKTAQEVIRQNGYTYPVDAALTTCYFPAKSYGDATFPPGNYQALRIRIGKAEGRNWWCVLYPNLCFIDSIHGVLQEEQKEKLQDVLTEEEYESLFDWRKSKFKITGKWFSWL